MVALTRGEILVDVERSGVIESRHSGHLVVLSPDGSVRHRVGDPEQPVFGRSSLKPLQAVGMVRAGLPTDDVAELALAAASHSGSELHLRLIEAELTASGLTESDLECPADLPLGEAERRSYLSAGRAPRRLAMNCSGKHTGMLRASLVNGWPVSGYLDPGHPLQVQLAGAVAELAGEPVAATGVDGCGAPLFAISLVGIARGFARIATGSRGTAEHAVAEAMRTYPELVAGENRVTTGLMRAVPGLIAKDGAEGVFAAALPDGGAVALKIDDGAARAAEVAVVAALEQLGVAPGVLAEFLTVPVLGGGRPVGRIAPAR